jgi:AhpC/TSA family protein/cytochrome c biogenesis DsbD-like protein
VQLQQSVDELRGRGIGLAAISYDPVATLKVFADAHGITFPLLADDGSATITRYGILNTEATGRTAGIPYPGTFMVDARGVVVARDFEEQYQERASASSIASRVTTNAHGGDRAETVHLAIVTSSSDKAVAPGTRFSLLMDVTPKPRMHVYAPGQKNYIPISITLEPDEALKVHPAVYPQGEWYLFPALNERQLVYSKPFRIVQDVTVALTPALRRRAAESGATLTIKGTIRYQACDDKVCYIPKDIPASWTVALRPLAR